MDVFASLPVMEFMCKVDIPQTASGGRTYVKLETFPDNITST